MTAWQILGIEPTDNKRIVKRAYAKKLKQFHPEEFPEEFKEIQDAYNSIMDAFNYDNSSIDLDRLNFDFHKEDTIYGEKTEDKETKDIQSSGYDAFHLDSAFHVIDEQDKKKTPFVEKDIIEHTIVKSDQGEEDKKTQSPYNTQDDTNDIEYIINQGKRMLQDIIYQKVEDTIRYDCNVETIKPLILNERFHEAIEDPVFFDKIRTLIIQYISTFDVMTNHFLSQTFSLLEEENHVENVRNSIPAAIHQYYEDRIKKQKAQNTVKSGFVFFVIAGLIVVFALSFTSKSHKKTEDINMEETINKIVDEEKETVKNLKSVAVIFSEQAIYDKYGVDTTCGIVDNLMEENSTVMVYCSTEDKSFTKSGFLTLNEYRKPVELKTYDEE